ncbi:MAG: rhodanese-like domain-containing protein [Verrucomicrobiota bacterium]|nr:rhodanese-like domain-containing protein [Limisphaera sp.]MDW8380774.1 rhodanese-like domain-containing protein [Verrucomicrobiota bacterium]
MLDSVPDKHISKRWAKLVFGPALEAGLVLLVGIGFAVLANSLSPFGLQWSRNYFPTPPATSEGPDRVSTAAPRVNAQAEAKARIESRGYAAWTFERAAEAFRDPLRLSGQIVFVDARAEIPYRRGHIPGALQFDPYRPDHQLLEVVAACLRAMRVIVYCTGGACEDAELAAALLEQAGVPKSRLAIYVGGFTEWLERGQPVEPPRTGPERIDKEVGP